MNELAARVLNIPVIAITGSAGKTTTKEMIASILRTRWRIFKSNGNQNLPIHTARYAKQVTQSIHRAAVLEYALQKAGYIRRHCQILQPSIGVVTNVGTAHIGNFGGDVRKLALGKSELIQYMKRTGILFLNRDDANSRLLRFGRFRGKVLRIGIDHEGDYRATRVRYTPRGMSFNVKLRNKVHTFQIPILGKHNVYNALFALGVADQLGFSPQEIKTGLRSFTRLSRRLTVYRLKNGIKVIDDSFSANPNAVKAAIDVLSHFQSGRKVAVLGAMKEMGNYTKRGHREVGRYVARRKVDRLYTFSPAARYIAEGAREAGFPAGRIRHFLDRTSLHRALSTELKRNTTFLVKGSHAVAMNKTVQFLRNRGT